jgi:hypothetical protein
LRRREDKAAARLELNDDPLASEASSSPSSMHQKKKAVHEITIVPPDHNCNIKTRSTQDHHQFIIQQIKTASITGKRKIQGRISRSKSKRINS